MDTPIADGSSPISDLPADLLSILFEMLPKNAHMYHDVKAAITLSHVCRFWRSIALSAPVLWTSIDLYRLGPEGARECSIRSQSLPILISIWPSSNSDNTSISSILTVLKAASWVKTNTSRVEAIHIKSYERVIKKLFRMLGDVFPLLSSLVLFSTDDNLHIPALTLSASNLSTLELTNFSVNLDVFENLTNLSVVNIAPGLDDDVYATQLLGLVGRSPNLEVLNINMLYILGYERPPTILAVELPSLVALHINNLLPGITTSFLAHFSIPASAPLVALGHRELAYLEIDFDQCGASIQVDLDGSPTLHIFEHGSGDPDEDMICMIPVLAKSVDLTPIHDFRATMIDPRNRRREMPVDHWKIIFEALSSLTSLTLTLPISWIRIAFQALHPDESAYSLILCPNLTRLRLIANTVDTPGAVGRVVVDCLKARSQRGLGPVELLVMNFGEDSTIDELNGIVTQVDQQVCLFVTVESGLIMFCSNT